MAADRHPGGGECFGQIGAPSCVFADLKECRLGAAVLQRLEYHRRVSGPWAIVEGQRDFLIAQEIILFEMLGSERRATCRIYLNESREPEGVRIIASSNWLWRHRGRWKSGRYGGGLFRNDCGGGKGAGVFVVSASCCGAFSPPAAATVFCED